jgi:hypothetical protein
MIAALGDFTPEHNLKKVYMIKEANHLVKLFLTRTGYAGITLPPFGIYILKERMSDELLKRHEMVHWEQYQRMGVIGFYVTYLWYNIRYGYWNNPMEIEARKKSEDNT